MVRTQIQLSKEQSKILKRLAAERDASVAALIREAVDMYVASKNKPDREELKRRALSVIGKYRSKERDISINHDKYLAEDFAK